VHIDEAALTRDEGGCELAEGPALAAETARRLACDASVVELRERDGQPLSVGRKTRSVPPALRRALARRDRGCRFPGCENRRFVDAHHIEHWARGGETCIDNLVLLCRTHHRLLHEGGYSLERLATGKLRFGYPWGEPIADSPRPPPGSVEGLLERNGELLISEYYTGAGDRMNLDLAVAALLAVDG
jgi:hypothetical protein